MGRLDRGEIVQVATTKWGGGRHWGYTGSYLGADDFGDWLAFPWGTRYTRPGHAFTAEFGCVSLVPRTDAAHFAAFYLPPLPDGGVTTYVDICTPPQWQDSTLLLVDLDLDVVRLADGTLYIDDEDEFEEHQLELGYPPEIIALAEESAERVYATIAAAQGPYDGSAEPWLGELASLPNVG